MITENTSIIGFPTFSRALLATVSFLSPEAGFILGLLSSFVRVSEPERKRHPE